MLVKLFGGSTQSFQTQCCTITFPRDGGVAVSKLVFMLQCFLIVVIFNHPKSAYLLCKLFDFFVLR